MTDKEHLPKSATNIIPHGEKLNAFSYNHTESIPIHYCSESPSKCNKVRKSNWKHSSWKERNKFIYIHIRHDWLHRKSKELSIKSSWVLSSAAHILKLERYRED